MAEMNEGADWRETLNQNPPAALVHNAPKGGQYIKLKDLERMADRLFGHEGWRLECELPQVVSDQERERPDKNGRPQSPIRVVTAQAKATLIVDADVQVVKTAIGSDSSMFPVGPDDCTALENALKAASTSAGKRAFSSLGRLFGRGL